jgi:endonuclease/exonuclease/phosphatase (EEP) superfamily protein YafD
LDLLLLTIAWLLILATLSSLIRHQAWWVRIFDFPRSQLALLGSIILLLLYWQFEDTLAYGGTAALLTLCVVYQFWELSAYTPLRKVQALPNERNEPERRIKILAANVLMTNRNVSEYLTLITEHDPDIVALAEPDEYWEERLRPLEERYPYTIRCPLSNTYGMMLYSRLKLSEQEILFRVEKDIPSFRCFVQLRTGDRIQLHCLHPRPPQPGTDTVTRDAELVIVGKEVKDSPHPIIVTGDMNDVAWSHTTRLFLRISGLLDPRVGRTFCNTFHAHYPFFRWPLDHLFHSRAFRFVRMERLRRTDSDHYPVLVELSFEPAKREEQERPEAKTSDMTEAREKIETAKKETGNTKIPTSGPGAG